MHKNTCLGAKNFVMELLNSLLFMLNEMSPYILLGFFIAGLMHAFVPQRTLSSHLGASGWKAVVKAAAIGIPLPLCSCGVLPTAIGMHRNGASKAASTSFLIATPQTGVDSIAATWSLLGPAFAVIRPLAALVTAVFGGVLVGRAEQTGVADAKAARGSEEKTAAKNFGAKCVAALRYGFLDLVGSIGGWLVAGLLIAALITVYVPADFFAVIGDKPILSMLAVLLIAVPMYVCATGSIPIALSLMLKGLSPGTALVLLMAGPAANFASFALISREMGRKSAVIYLVSIIIGSMAFGLLIDYLLPASWFALDGMASACCHAQSFALFPSVCSAILALMLTASFLRGHRHKKFDTSVSTEEYIVEGMNCSHCRASVMKAIASVEGVEQVDVDLSTGRATVQGRHKREEVLAAIRAAGFDVD